jgi:crotonobetainyl-CoA:carnitine CoA-transferase CaiB-like acyl-CoA transferase
VSGALQGLAGLGAEVIKIDEPRGGDPTAGALSDMIAGTFAALGVVASVHERERSGTGQEIDVSMADCLFAMMMDEPLGCYAGLGPAERQGNRIMRFSPFNTYPARDGWVALGAVTPEDWRAIASAVGAPSGADTGEVLARLLGLSAEEIAALEKKGVV